MVSLLQQQQQHILQLALQYVLLSLLFGILLTLFVSCSLTCGAKVYAHVLISATNKSFNYFHEHSFCIGNFTKWYGLHSDHRGYILLKKLCPIWCIIFQCCLIHVLVIFSICFTVRETTSIKLVQLWLSMNQSNF